MSFQRSESSFILWYTVVNGNIIGGVNLFIKRQSTRGIHSNVQFIKGSSTLGGVSLSVYAYCVDGVLIDTGSVSLHSEFTQFFNEMTIDQVLITHHHEDHTGGAAYIQQHFDVPIYMHEQFIESCKKRARYPLYRRFFWGRRPSFSAQALSFNETLTSKTSTWQAIKTPGHSSDHVAFLNERTGQLFSGDLYVHPETKLILYNESVPETIRSIERLLTYDIGEMFCSHAGYIDDGPKALRRKHSYLTSLRDEILYLHEEKGYSEKEIHTMLFTKKYPIMYFSLGEWHTKYIVRSVLTR